MRSSRLRCGAQGCIKIDNSNLLNSNSLLLVKDMNSILFIIGVITCSFSMGLLALLAISLCFSRHPSKDHYEIEIQDLIVITLTYLAMYSALALGSHINTIDKAMYLS